MSDSIDNDEKFRKLFNRYVSEYTQVLFESSYLNNKRTADLSSIEFELSHELVIEKLKDKSKTTLSHIFKYIDRRVERAVLEERAKQPLEINDRAEMMRVTSDGMCHIHEDYLSNVDILEHVKRAVVDELIKINPSSVLLPAFRIKVEAYPPSLLEISLKFYYNGEHYVCSTLVTIKKFDIRELVKEFSDKINKIARDKYAPK